MEVKFLCNPNKYENLKIFICILLASVANPMLQTHLHSNVCLHTYLFND